MSTAPKSPRAPSDPYRYGWRNVSITRPDGTEAIEQVPLTPEDVLHPEEGDFIVQTDAHNCDRGYLQGAFKVRLKDDPTSVVLADCGVDWNIPNVRPLCPDIAVFVNVKRHIDWNIFNVAAEGARPALVVEVTSRSTRKNDLGVKVDYYHRARVPLYLIADAVGRGDERRVELILYRYTRRGFRRVAPDENGRVYLEPVKLCVGVARDLLAGYERLACYDPETGEELGDYLAMVEARTAALQQARTAKRQAHAAQRQAAAAQRQAAAAQRQAAAEAMRAATEAQARAEAEARIRELEAELKNRRKNT
jgi:Putative restriction endonuclease